MMNFPSKRGAEEPQNPENHMVNRPYGTMKGSQHHKPLKFGFLTEEHWYFLDVNDVPTS